VIPAELEFNHPEAIRWLWLVAIVAAIALWRSRGRIRQLRRFAEAPLLAQIAPRVSLARPVARTIVTLAAMGMLVVALLDPRWGFQYEEVQRRGLDCFFVVDVSRSMLAEDATPNRLERAKAFIEDAVEALPGDRVGLIAYAGTASLRCPLTLNEDLFLMSLRELAPESTIRGGSLLGDAIRMASESFTDSQKGAKVVVVLTDGEDQGSFPVEAASKAYADLGVRVFTVGLGDSGDGARIPVETSLGRRWLVHEGQEVWRWRSPAAARTSQPERVSSTWPRRWRSRSTASSARSRTRRRFDVPPRASSGSPVWRCCCSSARRSSAIAAAAGLAASAGGALRAPATVAISSLACEKGGTLHERLGTAR
jgi:hypothetical protein